MMKILLVFLGMALFSFAKAQQQDPPPLLLSYTDDMVANYYHNLFKIKKSSFNIIKRRITIQGNLIIEVIPSWEFENFYKFSIIDFIFTRVNGSEMWCVKQVITTPEKYAAEILAPFQDNLDGNFKEISKGHWQKKSAPSDVVILDILSEIEKGDGGNIYSITYEYKRNDKSKQNLDR